MVPELKQIHPKLDLLCFWLLFCAASGVPVQAFAPAPECRHAAKFELGGCWGHVRGRVIWECTRRVRSGIFPYEVLYACEVHYDQDLQDEALKTCMVSTCSVLNVLLLTALPLHFHDFHLTIDNHYLY